MPRNNIMLVVAKFTILEAVVFGLQTEGVANTCGSCSCSTKERILLVDCSSRNLFDIPKDIPEDASELNLAGNRLPSIPAGSFAYLKKMTKLVISFNKITRIETESLSGLEDSLEFLDIDLNEIPYNSTGYAPGAISRLRRLTRLFMVTDPCPEEFPDEILSGLSALKELAISIPSNGSFQNSSASLVSLDTLHMSTNCSPSRSISARDLAALHGLPIRRLSFRNAKLTNIDPEALLPLRTTLRKLDISCNFLQNITNLMTGLHDMPLNTLLMDRAVARFHTLELDRRMFSALSSMNLSILTMSWNNILDVNLLGEFPDINLPNLKFIRLGYNQVSLKITSPGELMLGLASLIMNVRVLDLNGLLRFYDSYVKVLNCNGEDLLFADKKLDWEYDKLKHIPPKESPFQWLKNATYAFEFNNTLIMPPQMTRLYIRDVGQLFSDLNCQEFPWKLNDENNLQHVDVTYSVVPHVDCIVRGLSELYWLDAADIGLTGWVPMFFSNLTAPLLRHVNLHGNKLGEFLNKTQSWAPLNGTFNVTHLDLSGNGIINLPTDIFEYSPSLDNLNLSFNEIDGSWNVSLGSARKLRILDMSYNYIKAVSPSSLSDFQIKRRNSNSFKINMTHTDMACYSCTNEDFFTWYLTDPMAVVNLTCVDGDYRYPVTSNILLSIKWQCLYLKIVLAGISLVSLVSLLAIVYQSYKWSIKYLYYKAKRWAVRLYGRPTTTPVEVYVSCPESENSKAEKIKILLNKIGVRNIVTRENLELGKSKYDEVTRLVDSCLAVIILVSPTGVAGELSEFEFQMALQKGLGHIVLILTSEDLAIAKIPKSLRKLLNMNNYLKWPVGDEGMESQTTLNRHFNKFQVLLEAAISNIIRRTDAGHSLLNIANESDAADDESNQRNAEDLSASLQLLLGR